VQITFFTSYLQELFFYHFLFYEILYVPGPIFQSVPIFLHIVVIHWSKSDWRYLCQQCVNGSKM